MSWEFLVVVVLVVLAPGVDLLMVLRNTVAGGRRVGAATAAGIGVASMLQGLLVAIGVGALIVQSQWLFEALRWVGVAVLLVLGVQALWAAVRRDLPKIVSDRPTERRWARGFAQGFLCNATNPKMLVFYLSLLPQFVAAGAPLETWLFHAWMLPLIGTAWLLMLAVLAGTVREFLLKPLVRRLMDAVSGVALIGFGVKLATDQ
ncbi:LysE family translocator [Microbacterium sp. A8/3-1]|uniref:LysE family translocator n=1 Tax=Microbacterium sp. A8/3-1 TaxID=3160749 RepID=A0AAU7W482_9MICO